MCGPIAYQVRHNTWNRETVRSESGQMSDLVIVICHQNHLVLFFARTIRLGIVLVNGMT